MTFRHQWRDALAATCVVLAVASPAQAEGDLPYLSDQLRKPAYRKPLDAILRGDAQSPEWVRVFLRTKNGVDTPGSTVAVDGASFELYIVCQPHRCDGNYLYVLYPIGGGRAWAAITDEKHVVAVLGHPSESQKQTLLAPAKSL